jgi:hypothetical protein
MSAAEIIEFPLTDPADISHAIEELAILQKQAAAITHRANELRSKIRAGLASAHLDRFTSASGVRATLVTSTLFKGDRKTALRLLSANVVAEIFKPVTSTVLRVK